MYEDYRPRATPYYKHFHELSPEARKRALRSWREWWTPRADIYFGDDVDADAGGLAQALKSVRCELLDWELNYDGGVPACWVKLNEGLLHAMHVEHALGLPAAEGEGQRCGEAFAGRWNAECRPRLEAMLDGGGAEWKSERWHALCDAYLEAAQELASWCVAGIADNVRRRWEAEEFRAEEWAFTEDGEFSGHW